MIKKLAAFAMIVFAPATAFPETSGTAGASHEIVAKIEAKLLAKDIDGAIETSKALDERDWQLQSDINTLINYFDALQTFRSLVAIPGKASEAIAAYEPLVASYNDLPDPIPFSQYTAGFVLGSMAKSREYVDRECGSDYKNVKVGMKLARAQKCTGNFQLVGQIKKDNKLLSQYRNQDAYLYVKDGLIVAWNSF